MVKKYILNLVILILSGMVNAADFQQKDQAFVLDLVVSNPRDCIDHADICALADVNKYLQKRVHETATIRKDILRSAIAQEDSDRIPRQKAIFFNQYGSACIYVTVRKDDKTICCKWIYKKAGKIENGSSISPIMSITYAGFFSVGKVYKQEVPFVFLGVSAYGMGSGVKGPLFLNDKSSFSFFSLPDYHNSVKGTVFTFHLNGTEEKAEHDDLEMLIGKKLTQ